MTTGSLFDLHSLPLGNDEEMVLFRCLERDLKVVLIHTEEGPVVLVDIGTTWVREDIKVDSLYNSSWYRRVRTLIPEDIVRRQVNTFLSAQCADNP